MAEGTVKWFSTDKGYGFIARQGEEDVFVHYSAIVSDEAFKTLPEGAAVRFTVVDTDSG
ncbi:MAG: cold shock domain-containing protein, partial [Egibacteraceae bacterium]